jgi:hypothetical protein
MPSGTGRHGCCNVPIQPDGVRCTKPKAANREQAPAHATALAYGTTPTSILKGIVALRSVMLLVPMHPPISESLNVQHQTKNQQTNRYGSCSFLCRCVVADQAGDDAAAPPSANTQQTTRVRPDEPTNLEAGATTKAHVRREGSYPHP